MAPCPSCGVFTNLPKDPSHTCNQESLELLSTQKTRGILFHCPKCRQCELTAGALKAHSCRQNRGTNLGEKMADSALASTQLNTNSCTTENKGNKGSERTRSPARNQERQPNRKNRMIGVRRKRPLLAEQKTDPGPFRIFRPISLSRKKLFTAGEYIDTDILLNSPSTKKTQKNDQKQLIQNFKIEAVAQEKMETESQQASASETGSYTDPFFFGAPPLADAGCRGDSPKLGGTEIKSNVFFEGFPEDFHHDEDMEGGLFF